MGQVSRGGEVECSVCGRGFAPRFSFQQQKRGGTDVAYCSSRCQLRDLAAGDPVRCSACGAEFVPEFAFQTGVFDGRKEHFCTMGCRSAGPTRRESLIQRLAVYNLKGGTGKTTTAVSLAAALAEAGYRILLIDADPQGSVAVSLGLEARRGLYQVLVLGADPSRCTVEARPGLHVITSDRRLAAAEIYLGSRPERYRVMHDRFSTLKGYDLTIVDCAPSVGLISQNALRFADATLMPVSCEHLGLVGLGLAIRTLAELEATTGHTTKIAGIIPTFLDARLNVCALAMEQLQARYEGLVLPPIRTSAKLKEAPAGGVPINEHAPRSRGGEDYQILAAWVARRYLSDRASSPPEEPDEVQARSTVAAARVNRSDDVCL